MNKAVLYLNLGTPDSPDVSDVQKYLRQFLMDPLVIDIPLPLRALLVLGIIVPFRAKKSAHAYKSIWTDKGSPLKYLSENLVTKLNKFNEDNIYFELGMRYASPSIESALYNIATKKPDEIFVFSAYPQYALSSSETGFVEVKRALKAIYGLKSQPQVKILKNYPKESAFINAYAENITNAAKDFKPDHYFFSYHGLPIRHVKKISTACEGRGECSLQDTSENVFCYRRQCYQTTESLVQSLGLSNDQYTVGFQSRLSKNWIEPFSDDYFKSLPKNGVKKLLVACPSFTTDCLETLEEVAIRGREDFIAHGGEDLKLVPCLNDSDQWVQGVSAMINNSSLWTSL